MKQLRIYKYSFEMYFKLDGELFTRLILLMASQNDDVGSWLLLFEFLKLFVSIVCDGQLMGLNILASLHL
jgi:hypothetical protein